MWDRKYYSGALCLTDNFLFFREASGSRLLGLPLTVIYDMKRQERETIDSIHMKMQNFESVRDRLLVISTDLRAVLASRNG